MARVGSVSLVMAALLSGGYSHISIPSVSCLIINLEFINCTWTDQSIPELNYTFHSSSTQKGFRECPKYLLQDGHTMGCRLHYRLGQKFYKLSTRLFQENSSSERVQDINLKDLVKLDPPHFLWLEVKEGKSNPELWLHWNVSSPSNCVESEVLYRWGSGQRKISVPIGYSFSPPFFSLDGLYEFQVRIRVPEVCSQSKYWSDWSAPVSWVPVPGFNSAVSPHGSSNGGLCLWWIGWLWAAVGILIGRHLPS